LTIGVLREQSKQYTKRWNSVIIRSNVELRYSHYKSFYNQTLMCLEQFAKLRQFQNQTYIWKLYQAINKKYSAYRIEELNRNCTQLILSKLLKPNSTN
jgi:hypothetical protein